MIELFTGLPGSGKTLRMLVTVKARAEKEGRPVFYSGIPGLTLGWAEIDPEKWFEAPPNSIVVIDECQRVFRPRSWSGAVPRYVEELETHRHDGLDLVLATQHPMLVDANVRRLVGRHFHVSRRFGLERSSVFEFESCKEQPLAKIDSATARHEWPFPKEAYGWYKSAEVHTHKARIPAKVWIVILMLLLVVGSVTWFVLRWKEKMASPPAASGVVVGSVPSTVGWKPAGDNSLAWYVTQTPRVVGLPHTAPTYDDVLKKSAPPLPVACVSSASRCVCNSQQGTKIAMPEALCRQIVADGFFRPDLQDNDGGGIAARRPADVKPVQKAS